MSDKERPRADDGGGGGGGGSGGVDDEDDGEETTESVDSSEKTCAGCDRKGNKRSFFRLRKGKKPASQKRKQKGIYVNSGCWMTRVGRGSTCLSRPRVAVDSSGESPTSDPNSPEFTFGMLRTLIEKNDFYSKECNPHLDHHDYVKQGKNT
ncbi:hypothetical protein ABFX02_14G085400 [Erythranthe guttata]